jgi:uncharacterized protein
MILKYLVAGAFLGLTASSVSAQTVRAGIEAWQRADYSAAVAIWRPLAEKGDADAAFNLGQAYRLGRGVPTNIAAASTWYERAAAKGHVDAETTLGLLLFQNGDQAAGLRWLKAAAEKGEPRALLVYGTALVNGDGVTRDPVLGYAFISRAAAQGLPAAKETLAQLNQIMPVDARKKGVAIAMSKANTAPPPSSKPTPTPKPKPVVTTSAKPARPAAQPAPVTQTAPVAASGAWRVQLGAFSQRASAEALYQRLSGNSALAGRKPSYIPVGAITRLQVGPFESKAAAMAACKAVATACFPVPAK